MITEQLYYFAQCDIIIPRCSFPKKLLEVFVCHFGICLNSTKHGLVMMNFSL
nr:MAG TPA: hypothetical protein [Microviridae sp.]